MNIVNFNFIKTQATIAEWANENPIIFGLIVVLAIILIVLIMFLIVIKIKVRDKSIKKSHSHGFGFKNSQKFLSNHKFKNISKEALKEIDAQFKDNNVISEEIQELKFRLAKELSDTHEYNLHLLNSKKEYENYSQRLNHIIELENIKLSEITKLSIEDAKKLLLSNLYKTMRKELNEFFKDERDRFRENAKTTARQILIYAMEGMAEDVVAERSVAVMPIDETLKGKVIGKNGRNKNTFEMLTGVDMVIEKQAEITISSTNPIRKEIAINLFNAMMLSKNIEPSKIESLFQTVKSDFDGQLIEYGRQAIEDNLKVYDINPEIYGIVGRLRFRTSYGQNVLKHCLECASYASAIATYLGIDPEKAKLAAFFHDIGKAIDFEENYDHVESGVEIAKKYKLPDYICNAIEAHHNKIEPSTIYGALVKIVDTLSAARPGARNDSLDEYIKRVQKLENVCKEIEGVKEAYAIRSGRVVRIIIEPEIIMDDQLELLGYEVKRAIEKNDLTNKYQIKIQMIREKRVEFLANNKKGSDNFLDTQFYPKEIIKEDGNF